MENESIDLVISTIRSLDAKMDLIKKERDTLLKKVSDYFSGEIRNQLSDKDYGAGTANVLSGLFKVKCTIGKKVKWDQSLLKSVYEKLQNEWGENPEEYMKVSYDVSETAYKNWPSGIQKVFEPARTVELSAPRFEFTDRTGEK